MLETSTSWLIRNGLTAQPHFALLSTSSMSKPGRRKLEKSIAVASFIVAVVLSFVSLSISANHDIASNTLFVIAQFLTLTATILGIDYKFSARPWGQQPPSPHN